MTVVAGRPGTIQMQFNIFTFQQNGIQRGAAAEGRRPSLEGWPEAALHSAEKKRHLNII